MTRLFLAAGVAALAIAAPSAAKPGGGHGGQQQAEQQRGAKGGGARVERSGGGQRAQAQRSGGGQRMQAQRVERGGGQRMQQAQRAERRGGGRDFSAPRMQRQERVQHQARQQMRVDRGNQVRSAQNRNIERQQTRVNRAQAQNRNFERQQVRANRAQQANRNIDRQRNFDRQQIRSDRFAQQQDRRFERQQFRADRQDLRQQQAFDRRINGQRFAQGKFRNDEARFIRNQQQAYWRDVNATRFAAINDGWSSRLWAPTIANRFIGAPIGAVTGFTTLGALPMSVAYLYPNTNDYYYRYGDGYLYQVNRGDNLISALFPLIAGGYLPGQYLPQPYMASYVPNYYGFNSFYPDYGNDCNRYANGVIYEVDCYTGMIEDVIPLYAGGYGVGQVLPASYAYYNVPYQYRTMYYDTPNYNYWYAPGAIYQYDPGTSMITSVAALLSPGFTVGQALPAGYGVYNVPYAYRQTYYDTPNAWYRYNNGYIYQVDPATQLVTAIVASLLT